MRIYRYKFEDYQLIESGPDRNFPLMPFICSIQCLGIAERGLTSSDALSRCRLAFNAYAERCLMTGEDMAMPMLNYEHPAPAPDPREDSVAMAPMRPLGGGFFWADQQFQKPGLYFFYKWRGDGKNLRLIPWPAAEVMPELVQFAEQTVVIAKDQPEYRPIPAHRWLNDPEGRVTFCWKLGLRARLRVLFGGRLWHSVLTFNTPMQPQMMDTRKPANMPCHRGCTECRPGLPCWNTTADSPVGTGAGCVKAFVADISNEFPGGGHEP